MSEQIQPNEIVAGSTISFDIWNTLPNIPTPVSDATVVGVVTFEGLINKGLAVTNHLNIYASIPSGLQVPNDATKYQYAVISAVGQTYEIGIPWINSTTLFRKNAAILTVIIEDFDPTQRDSIVAAIAAITSGKITTTIS